MRDPRFSPEIGDVLRKGGIQRTVTGIIYPNWVFWLEGVRELRRFVGAWRDWPNRAEVVTVGGGK